MWCNHNNSKKAVGRRMNKHRVRTVVLSALATSSLLVGTVAMGQTSLNDVLNEGISANQVAQESQVRVDAIVD